MLQIKCVSTPLHCIHTIGNANKVQIFVVPHTCQTNAHINTSAQSFSKSETSANIPYWLIAIHTRKFNYRKLYMAYLLYLLCVQRTYKYVSFIQTFDYNIYTRYASCAHIAIGNIFANVLQNILCVKMFIKLCNVHIYTI